MTSDVNVLVAASRQDHPHYAQALRWLQEALAIRADGGRSLAILPIVGSGFVRLVTHPKVFVEPTPIAAALKSLRSVLNSPGASLLSEGNKWPVFERLCEKLGLTSNAIPDAWIAAAVQNHHLHLVTFDKGFRKLLKPSTVTLLKAELGN
jgi:toxin-antitoxin system PIN domain toxin